MEAIFLKYISVALASTLKFFGGPITGVLLNLTWIETALCSIAGMMFSVLIVTYVGKIIQTLIKKYRTKTPKRFSKTNRMAVKIWKKFGIIGIALLTPPLFTPIFGTALAVAFRVPRGAIFLWMSLSALGWGLFVSYVAHKMTFIQEWIK